MQKVLSSGCKLGWRFPRVGNVHNFSIEIGGTVHVFARERDRPSASPHLYATRVRHGQRSRPQRVSIWKRNKYGGVGKDLEPALHDRFENGLRVGRRSADQLENFSGRRLLMKCLVALATKEGVPRLLNLRTREFWCGGVASRARSAPRS